MRYFLELAYNGDAFHGWQSQPNASSVQETLEGALSKILRAPTKITGAGRTDTGVHARQMFAHFDTLSQICDAKGFLISLNSLLGKNIAVSNVLKVAEEAHARFDATQRTYKYFITFNKNPFLHEFCWKSPSHLDIDLMNRAAELLLSTSDFTSFAKLHSDVKTNICDVSEALWRPINEDPEANEFLGNLDEGIVFTISADRFLRNMVRAIVGTLVDVGRGKMSISQFQEIINKRDRCSAGTSMPPQALYLWRIRYPYVNSGDSEA
ncbi:MAG: tRNA pseudouridine(38-40) synthase TruA [Muribaculaceae bacterium]|nr:tRNA pseudouridine(38-40) synthase TruA [Muribaculaceae bacterium]